MLELALEQRSQRHQRHPRASFRRVRPYTLSLGSNAHMLLEGEGLERREDHESFHFLEPHEPHEPHEPGYPPHPAQCSCCMVCGGCVVTCGH